MRFKTGAEEEETDDEGEGGSTHFAVNGLGGGKGGPVIEEGGTR